MCHKMVEQKMTYQSSETKLEGDTGKFLAVISFHALAQALAMQELKATFKVAA